MSERECLYCCADESQHAKPHPHTEGPIASICEQLHPGGIYEHGPIKCRLCGKNYQSTVAYHVCNLRNER